MTEQTRRSFLRTLLGTAALVTAGSALNGCATVLETVLEETSEKKGRYETIAHNFLDIESPDLGVVDSDYQVLDDIIDEAKERISKIKLDKPFTEYTKEEAVNVLKTIDNVLTGKRFNYGGNVLLNAGLKNKRIDCDNYSIIYLGIADALNLPLKAASAPRHVFVRWHFNKDTSFNWETIRARDRLDSFYIKEFNIPDISIENDVFLESLSREETYSIAYNMKGLFFYKLKKYGEALKSFEKARELNPNDPDIYNGRANALRKLRRYEEASESYDKVRELNPNQVPLFID